MDGLEGDARNGENEDAGPAWRKWLPGACVSGMYLVLRPLCPFLITFCCRWAASSAPPPAMMLRLTRDLGTMHHVWEPLKRQAPKILPSLSRVLHYLS